jgi:site-specific DNA-methyltransferase (adenine-specific)
VSRYALHLGDCRESMASMAEASVDAIVTDPPYGLASGPTTTLEEANGGRGFMGREWDRGVPGPSFWREALRVAKPGAHLLAFGGTRAFHRMAVAIEDAGWVMRDCACWVYGSGFPKSHNGPWGGTALKPAWEPIVMARKPLEGTLAANHAAHGVGGLNVAACRIGTEGGTKWAPSGNRGDLGQFGGGIKDGKVEELAAGRWPANLLHDGSPEAEEPLGEASRFFYCPKTSPSDREEGCDHLEAVRRTDGRETDHHVPNLRTSLARNHHPTVKPTELMRYLVRLITPKGGLVLDPFMGSGSTGKAAMLEGARFAGCDLDPAYLAIAEARIRFGLHLEALEAAAAYEATRQLSLFGDL